MAPARGLTNSNFYTTSGDTTTGRFQGITGKVTFVGQLSSSVSEKDWVGSYSLPNK